MMSSDLYSQHHLVEEFWSVLLYYSWFKRLFWQYYIILSNLRLNRKTKYKNVYIIKSEFIMHTKRDLNFNGLTINKRWENKNNENMKLINYWLNIKWENKKVNHT